MHTTARFPFGKYRGQPVSAATTNYLLWIIRNVDLDPGLRAAVIGELRDRHEQRLADAAEFADPQPEQPQTALMPAVVRDWYSTMARRHHPDRGGSDTAMQVVNEGRELLMELVTAT